VVNHLVMAAVVNMNHQLIGPNSGQIQAQVVLKSYAIITPRNTQYTPL
jgi:hypothetical protein